LTYVSAGVPVYLIDPNHVAIASGREVHVIQKGASAGMEEFSSLFL
jgi:NAD-dependent deacetylase